MADCTQNLKIILEGFISLQNEQDPARQQQLRKQIKDAYFYLIDNAGQGKGKDNVGADDFMGDVGNALESLEGLGREAFLKIAAELTTSMPDIGRLYEFPQDLKDGIKYSADKYTFIEFNDLEAFYNAKLSLECTNQIYYVKFTENGKSYVLCKMRNPAHVLRNDSIEVNKDLTGEKLKQFIFSKLEKKQCNSTTYYDFDQFHAYCVAQLQCIYSLPRIAFNKFLSQLANQCANIGEINQRLEELVGNGIKKTALHYAVEFNDADLIRALIAKGAQVNEEDDKGETPLHYAARNNAPELVKLLIEKGADVIIVDNNGKKAIDLAEDKEVLRSLVEAGAEKAETSPLLYTIQVGGKAFRTTLEFFSDYANTQEEVKEAVDYLIRGKAINKIDSEGKTALHYAARNNAPELVKLLIEKGADVTIVDNNGKKAIDLAEDKEVLRSLVEAGAEKAETSPLLYAIQVGGKAFGRTLEVFSIHSQTQERVNGTVSILRENKAINKVDSDGKTALHHAVQADNVELVKALTKVGADVNKEDAKGRTPLYYAAESGNVESVSALIEAGADVNKVDTKRKTLLHDAAKSGNPKLICLLIKEGLHVEEVDTEDKTPLHYAVESGNVEAVSALITEGSNVNQADATRKTPLHYAVESGNVEVVSALLGAGADINCPDLNGGTPLHYTLQTQNGVKTALLLLKAGADIYQQYPMQQSEGGNKLGPSVCAYSKRTFPSKNTEAAALIQRYHTLSTIGKVALGVGCVVGVSLVILAAAALVATVVGVTHGAALAPLAVAAHTYVPSAAISVGAIGTLSASYALFKHIKKTRDELSHRFAAWAIGYEFFRPSRKSEGEVSSAFFGMNLNFN